MWIRCVAGAAISPTMTKATGRAHDAAAARIEAHLDQARKPGRKPNSATAGAETIMTA
jgi:hypothetical protein